MKSFWLARHGLTKMNNVKDTSQDRIRAWLDVPLTPEGRVEAERIADKLKGAHIEHVITSDLSRAHETGKIIADRLGAKCTKTKKLRPWDLGIYAGKSTKESMPEIARYACRTPDEKVPGGKGGGGESFNSFRARAFDGLKDIHDHPNSNLGNLAVVTHHRIERLLKAWIKQGRPADGKIDLGVFLQRGEDPGHVEKIIIGPRVPVLAAHEKV